MGSLEENLFLACSRGDVEGVKHYLKIGANMNSICSTGRTAFGTAAQLGNTAILKAFLDHCSDGDSMSTRFEQLDDYDNKKHSEDRSNLGYFVFVHNDHQMGSSIESCIKNNVNLSDSIEDLYGCDDNITSVFMGNMNEDSFDLATFNDPFIRRDPRFSSDWVDFLRDDETLTPDGMDNLEWDMEVEGGLESALEEDDPWSALYLWYAGILSQTSALLEKAPPATDIDREDQYGRRAMHYAAVEGHLEAVQMLLDAGCKTNVGDSDNLTPLHLAAARNVPAIVELLIQARANVHHKTTDKISPLHVSASRGLLDNVRLLVEAGAHVDTLDSSDRTPLFMAVSRCHEEVVTYLLERGAKVNIEEIHGYTPLYEAVWQKNVGIVRRLLGAGAKVTQSHLLLHYAVLHRHHDMVRLLIEAGSIINLRDESGDTPLMVAARTQQCAIARLLLDNGASVNCASYVTGNTALHEAVENLRGGQDAFEEMLALLQDHDVNLDAECESKCGYTPLELAVAQKKDEAAASLVRRGAAVYRPGSSHHLDPFACILLRGNRYLAELFVHAGYPLQKLPVSSRTPLSPLELSLTHLRSNAMRLCDLCRIAIRRQFKSKIYQKVSQSSLPLPLQRFLKLQDIYNCD